MLQLRPVFLSTPSARRATLSLKQTKLWQTISIHALREEGDSCKSMWCRAGAISIHALREEGDLELALLLIDGGLFLSTPSARRATSYYRFLRLWTWISIHALREEGDDYRLVRLAKFDEFLSTPSARRATSSGADLGRSTENFYPRPPRGGRRMPLAVVTLRFHFYPRPPRGGRPAGRLCGVPAVEFLSTPSARRATIKALHRLSLKRSFLSTPSARRATSSTGMSSSMRVFLSTPSARRATDVDSFKDNEEFISIHALREEGDHCLSLVSTYPRKFLSTPSARRATYGKFTFFLNLVISIHALREEGDQGEGSRIRAEGISIHALREEGDEASMVE